MVNMIKEKEEYDPKSDPEVIEFKRVIRAVLMVALIMILISTIWTIYLGIGYGYPTTSQSSDINYNYSEIDFFNSSYSEAPIQDDSVGSNMIYRNMRNIRETTEYYNATYSFTNDTNGLFPDDWESHNGATTNEAFVYSNYGQHDKVLILHFDADIGLKQAINPPDLSSVEFWVLKDFGSAGIEIDFYDSTETSHILLLVLDYNNNGLIREYEGSGVWETISTNYRDDGWIHIRIDFDDVAHLNNIYVNGVLEKENNPYMNNVDLEVMRVRFGWSSGDSKCYFDAIGYSWDDDYDIGDNFKPYTIYDNAYEVDTWDFWYEAEGDKLLTGDDNPNGWSDIEDGADDVNCLQDSVVQISGPSTRDVGLEKTDFTFQWTERLEVFIGFNVKAISATLNNYIEFYIYSYDSTEIARIYFEGDGNELGYYDGSRNVLTSGLSEDYWYYIRLSIDYGIDTCYLELGNYTYEPYTEGKMNTTFNFFHFDLTVAGKDGLSKIKTFITTDTGTTNFYLDYIGVYVNDTSVSDEFGWYGLNILTTGEYVNGVPFYYDYWNFIDYNMVRYNIEGEQIEIYIWLSEFMSIPPPTPIFTPVVGAKDYDGSEQFFNVGDFKFDPGERNSEDIYGGVLWFTFYENFSFTWLDIYGLRFSDGNETWSLEFETGSLGTDDSKFWVSGNKFYFSMTTDDDNTEFIEITFKLYDDYWQYGNWVLTTNRSVRWGGKIDQPYLFADFKINYANGEYNSFKLKNSYQYINQLIAQEIVIISFGLLISDNDNDFDNTINGYLEPMILYWNPGAALDITITNYINIIPGVALIAILSISIWALSKKKLGNMLIVPSIALTSALSYISDFIPLWILFIMLISCGTLLYSKWKELFLVFSSFMTMILAFLHYGGVIDLWVFYGSFMLTIGYTIFIGVKDIKGERIQ